MVKNIKGGSGHKKMASKFVNAEKATFKTRLANRKEPCEMYASVLKMYGQNCDVICNDGKQRVCFIRNKFKGRNKRGNVISVGTKLLVGLRDWETLTEKKKEKCDLLEVYDKKQHKDLINDRRCNWDTLLSEFDRPKLNNDDAFDFDENADEYNDLMEQIKNENTTVLTSTIRGGGGGGGCDDIFHDYDIDDI
jgi:translation initiation factor IF-1